MHFALFLKPARADFMQTMTDQERNIMTQHVAYWKEYLDKGIMLIYGPVMDPAGGYGLGIMEVESEVELKSLISRDPAATINRYEYFPMRAVTKLSSK